MRLASAPAVLAARPREKAPVPGAPRAAKPVAAEVGSLFRDLRRVLRLSLPQVALRLDTHVDVITALEQGDVRRLPPWPETVRVVTSFTALGGIDARPVLGILFRETQQQQQPRQQQPQPAPRKAGAGQRRARAWAGSVMAGAADAAQLATRIGGSFAGSFGAERLARYMPRLTRKSVVAILVSCLLAGSYVALSTLLGPAAQLKRSAEDYMLWWSAPTREGLKWIEVDDPRSRRADRLDTGRLEVGRLETRRLETGRR